MYTITKQGVKNHIQVEILSYGGYKDDEFYLFYLQMIS